jgi:hypothetical protein
MRDVLDADLVDRYLAGIRTVLDVFDVKSLGLVGGRVHGTFLSVPMHSIRISDRTQTA